MPPPTLAASKLAVRIAPYIWNHLYTLISPATCFVLDDGSGAAVVGYVDEILLAREEGAAADVPVPMQLERLEPSVARARRCGVRRQRGVPRADGAQPALAAARGRRGQGGAREGVSGHDAYRPAGGVGARDGRHVYGEREERVGFRVYEGGEREGGRECPDGVCAPLMRLWRLMFAVESRKAKTLRRNIYFSDAWSAIIPSEIFEASFSFTELEHVPDIIYHLLLHKKLLATLSG